MAKLSAPPIEQTLRPHYKFACAVAARYEMRMKKIFLLPILLSFGFSAAAQERADDPNWRAEKIMYCSDGEFDWDSGQSLYDFVILTRAPDDFIVSYLGIPHPSFERRDFRHLWMKMVGNFTSSFEQKGEERIYTLRLALDDEPVRTGSLVIGADDYYKFTMTPPLPRLTTTAGLCWDSLKPEPRELRNKRR